MTIDVVRSICRAFPAVTEDIKWGSDLVFSVGAKMFAVVNTERPHTVAFKCTPDTFAELIERGELEELLKTSYEIVVAKLPKSKRPGAKTARKSPSRKRPSPRSRGV